MRRNYDAVADARVFVDDGAIDHAIAPDADGRCLVEELEIEVGLHDGWVRFWHRGELLPLPADYQREMDEKQRALSEMTRRAEAAERELAEVRARGKNGKN